MFSASGGILNNRISKSERGWVVKKNTWGRFKGNIWVKVTIKTINVTNAPENTNVISLDNKIGGSMRVDTVLLSRLFW